MPFENICTVVIKITLGYSLLHLGLKFSSKAQDVSPVLHAEEGGLVELCCSSDVFELDPNTLSWYYSKIDAKGWSDELSSHPFPSRGNNRCRVNVSRTSLDHRTTIYSSDTRCCLKIRNLKESDGGVYHCFDVYGDLYESVKLYVVPKSKTNKVDKTTAGQTEKEAPMKKLKGQDADAAKSVNASYAGKERVIVTLGLHTGRLVEQKMCEISLDQRYTVKVINHIPALVEHESAACVINNILYAVGLGAAGNELWKWSAMTGEWTRCADLTLSRRRHCVTPVGDKIYVLGGWDDAEKEVLDDILYYDINSDTWTEVSAYLLYAVWGAPCLTYKHRVYVFGGVINDDEPVNYVQVYDTLTDQVTLSAKPMPAITSLMRAVLWRSKALLIGRYTCYIYDFETHTWEERKRFKTDFSYFGLSLDDNTLYISGGGTYKAGVWTCRDDVLSLSVYDLISNNEEAGWRQVNKLPAPALIQSYSPVPLYKP